MDGDKEARDRPGAAGEAGTSPEGAEPCGGPRFSSEGPVYESLQLFGGHKQVVIGHNGCRYVLRITRQGKLVLNK